MGRLPKHPELRAHQRARLAKLAPNTWPQSQPTLQGASPQVEYPALSKAVESLVHSACLAEKVPEYGRHQLGIYRELRAILYDTIQHQHIAGSPKHNGNLNGDSMNSNKPLQGASLFADPQRLIDRLWEKYKLNQSNDTNSSENLFTFLDLTKNHKPAIEGDEHDAATAELAQGYDTFATPTDLMAAFGTTIAEWCASYTKWHPGVNRRWSLYSAMNDTELVSSLARLAPRSDCHMKDAMLQGMSGGEVVDTVIMPCTGMFSDSPSGQGYSGDKVWPASLLVCIVVWADYAGAADAKSSAGHRVWDLLAPWCSALATASGVAADEVKATTMTLYGAKLGLFSPAPRFDCTHIWRSRGYDGGVRTSAAAIAMTRGVEYPESPRTLDLAGTVMAIHDSIDREADVINRTECNLVLITVHRGIGVECLLDTIYATFVVNWTATDIYGQLPLGALQEQTSGSRWGGPAYSTEARVSTSGINLWTSALSDERIANVSSANILPTTTKLLSAAQPGTSWHEMAMHLSAHELLESGLGSETGEPGKLEDLLRLSKGTFVLICCDSCASCSRDPEIRLDDWTATYSDSGACRVKQAIRAVRDIVDGPLEMLRAWLHSDPRNDAIYRITAEAFMALTPESRYIIMLLEGLIIEDALYHGVDTLSHCISWLPKRLHAEGSAPMNGWS